MLLRSIEKKYPKTDPDVQLQGAWIFTALKQESAELVAAFKRLDGRRVHFAVFGGWESGVLVLARRDQDRPVVLAMLGEHESPDGFEFKREPNH